MNNKYVFGVDIGGTRTKIGLVDLTCGEVCTSTVFPTEKHDEMKFFMRMQEEIRAQLSSVGIREDEVKGIGVALGSYVYTDEGIVDSMCGFIDFMEYYRLGDRMQELLGWPCKLDNDARAISYAEALYGAGRKDSRMLMLTLGTGVGVGFVVDNAFPDRDASIHLAGHIKVREAAEHEECLDRDGCYCKVSGCLESTCSGTALEIMARNRLGSTTTNKELFRLAGKGDAEAVHVIDWYLDMLLRGLNQYVYLFAPDVIVLGGGVSGGLAPWLEKLNEGLIARVHTRHCPRIVLAQLNEHGGIIGAASLFSEDQEEKNEDLNSEAVD